MRRGIRGAEADLGRLLSGRRSVAAGIRPAVRQPGEHGYAGNGGASVAVQVGVNDDQREEDQEPHSQKGPLPPSPTSCRHVRPR